MLASSIASNRERAAGNEAGRVSVSLSKRSMSSGGVAGGVNFHKSKVESSAPGLSPAGFSIGADFGDSARRLGCCSDSLETKRSAGTAMVTLGDASFSSTTRRVFATNNDVLLKAG